MVVLESLYAQVGVARSHYLAAVEDLTTAQGHFRPTQQSWSIAEVTEHLVHAEQGGILSIWKAAVGVRTGEPVWIGHSSHEGLSIEEVVERTWRPREEVPEGAAPRMGGPLGFWTVSLSGCQALLPSLTAALEGLDLNAVIFPHPISGPLDARQRLEFLRFHLDRHLGQVEAIRMSPVFPRGALPRRQG